MATARELIRSLISIARHAPPEIRTREIVSCLNEMSGKEVRLALTVMSVGRGDDKDFDRMMQSVTKSVSDKEAAISAVSQVECLGSFLAMGLDMPTPKPLTSIALNKSASSPAPICIKFSRELCSFNRIQKEAYTHRESSMTPNQVGYIILFLRRERGMNQSELASLTGLQQPNLSRIERGLTLPRLTTLTKIAMALDVCIAVLSVSQKSFSLIFSVCSAEM